MLQMIVQGREYPFPDPTTITFKEAKILKDNIGTSMVSILQNLSNGEADVDTLLSMFLLAKMRADGDFDLEQVMNLKISDLEIREEEEEADVKAADGAADTDAPLQDVKEPSSRKKKPSGKSAS